MIILTVTLLSIFSLAYEVLLARFFAVAQWSHLSFLVISIALLGYSIGGITIHLRRVSLGTRSKRPLVSSQVPSPGPTREQLSRLLVLAGIISAAAYLAANWLPLDYIRLPFDWRPLQFGKRILSPELARGFKEFLFRGIKWPLQGRM